MKSIKNMLEERNLSIHKVSEMTDEASYTAIFQAIRRYEQTGSIASWSVKIINALADGLGMSPGELLDELQGNTTQRSIKYDDKHLVLQGYQFKPDEFDLYKIIKQAVLNCALSGFKPTRDDIEMVASIVENPNAPEYSVWREEWLKSTVLQAINIKNNGK